MICFRVIRNVVWFLLVQGLTEGIPLNNFSPNTEKEDQQAEDLNVDIFHSLADIYKILSRHVNFSNSAKALSVDINKTLGNEKFEPTTQIQIENTVTLLPVGVLLQPTSNNFESITKNYDAHHDVSYLKRNPDLLSLQNLSSNYSKVQTTLNRLPKKMKFLRRRIKKNKKGRGWHLKNNAKYFQNKKGELYDNASEKSSHQYVTEDKNMSKPSAKSSNSLYKRGGKLKSQGIKNSQTYVKYVNNLRVQDLFKATTPLNTARKYKIRRNKEFKLSMARSVGRLRTFRPVRRYMHANISPVTLKNHFSTMEYEKLPETIQSNVHGEVGNSIVGFNGQIESQFRAPLKRKEQFSHLVITGAPYKTASSKEKRHDLGESEISHEEPVERNYTLQSVDYIQSHLVVLSFSLMCFLILSLLVSIVVLFGKHRSAFLRKTWKSIKSSPNMIRKFELPARPQSNNYDGSKSNIFGFNLLQRGQEEEKSLFSIGSASDCNSEDDTASKRCNINISPKPLCSESFDAVNEIRKNDKLLKTVVTAPSEKLIQLHRKFSCKETSSSSSSQKSEKSSSVKQHVRSEQFAQINTENFLLYQEDENFHSEVRLDESVNSNDLKSIIEDLELEDEDAVKELSEIILKMNLETIEQRCFERRSNCLCKISTDEFNKKFSEPLQEGEIKKDFWNYRK